MLAFRRAARHCNRHHHITLPHHMPLHLTGRRHHAPAAVLLCISHDARACGEHACCLYCDFRKSVCCYIIPHECALPCVTRVCTAVLPGISPLRSLVPCTPREHACTRRTPHGSMACTCAMIRRYLASQPLVAQGQRRRRRQQQQQICLRLPLLSALAGICSHGPARERGHALLPSHELAPSSPPEPQKRARTCLIACRTAGRRWKVEVRERSTRQWRRRRRTGTPKVHRAAATV